MLEQAAGDEHRGVRGCFADGGAGDGSPGADGEQGPPCEAVSPGRARGIRKMAKVSRYPLAGGRAGVQVGGDTGGGDVNNRAVQQIMTSAHRIRARTGQARGWLAVSAEPSESGAVWAIHA